MFLNLVKKDLSSLQNAVNNNYTQNNFTRLSSTQPKQPTTQVNKTEEAIGTNTTNSGTDTGGGDGS